jgi:hypothetical protein
MGKVLGSIYKSQAFGAAYSTLMMNNKNIHPTYLHPSSHPSTPVPDVLPDASVVCTLLIKLGLTFKKVC